MEKQDRLKILQKKFSLEKDYSERSKIQLRIKKLKLQIEIEQINKKIEQLN